jgi:hypothetical protein
LKQFLISIVLGFLAALGVWVGLFFSQLGTPTPTSIHLHQLLQRKRAYLQQAPAPGQTRKKRMIVVGGSNALFGLRASVLEKMLDKKVGNLATYAYLPLPFLVDQVKQVARPQDTVLLSLEYEFYYKSTLYPRAIDYIVAREPAYIRRLTWWKQLQWILSVSTKRMATGLKYRKKRLPRVQSKGTYTPQGDLLQALASIKKKRGDPRTHGYSPLAFPETIDSQTPNWKQLRSFALWCRQKRVKLLITFPSLLLFPEYKKKKGVFFRLLMKQLRGDGFRTVGTPFQFMYPLQDIHDGHYHLYRRAAIRHTRRVAKQL